MSSLRDRDARLASIVGDLQGRLGRIGIATALLHESAGPLSEHDLDLALDGTWQRVRPVLFATLADHGHFPLLVAEYDVAGAWYVVFGARSGTSLTRIALDLSNDSRGIGKFGVPMRKLLARTVIRDGMRYADPAWESAYEVAKHVWKGIPASDNLEAAAARIRSDPNAFVDAARHSVGRTNAEVLASRALAHRSLLSRKNVPRLLRAIHLRRALRSPLLPLRFVRRWLGRTRRPTGTWIVVAGPDGCGKSTVASRLHGALSRHFRRSMHLHWSPGMLPRPGSLLGRPSRDPSRPHQARPFGRALSLLALAYHWLDHALGYALKIRPALIRSGVVVMERGYHDLVVDPRRYRINLPGGGAIEALGRLLPRPDLTILLVGDPTVLHDRKPELRPEEIARQIERWTSISSGLGRVAVVDTGGSPDQVMAQVFDVVLGARAETLGGPGWRR